MDAAQSLNAGGCSVRVVAMPCAEVFDIQDEDYRESVLPTSIKCRVAVEAATTAAWYRYVGIDGRVIGIDTYGASAPSADTFVHFGFTAEHVVEVVEALLQ